jgi:phosphonoacetaldehyde hydrolase
MEFIYHRTYRGPIKAVLLDWAGTTVDYGSFAPTAVFLRLFERHGVKITAEDARSGMGLMKKDHLRTIFAQPAVTQAWQDTYGRPYNQLDIDRLFAEFVPMQIECVVDFADPIPGCVETIQNLRERQIKVGSTTGYIRSMMDKLMPAARERGYEPDSCVCPDEVPVGRPYPWMCYQNAIQLQTFPFEAMIKVGDTIPDIEEGLNANMWTVGITMTGNMMGLRRDEILTLPPESVLARRASINEKLSQAGAHFVIDSIAALPDVVDEIQNRLNHGEKP